MLVKSGARGEGQQPVQLQLFDLNGQSLLRYQLVMGADELPPVVAINDQPRRMVLGRPSTNELIYLDATGREIFRTHLLRNSPFSWERSMQAVFADSGTHFAVATMQEPARPENPFAHRNVHVFMYAANGHLLWHKILPEQSLGALAIARDAAYLAVATYDSYTQPGKIMQKTRIFNLAGREIAAAPILFKQAHFLPGRPHVFFHSNRTLWRLDLDSGHFTPLLQVRKPGEQILAATFSGRTNQWAVALGKSVFAAGHFQFASPSLLILNPEGKEVNRLTWEGQSLRAPFVSPSQAGSQILLFFENHLEIYPWNP
ncbi:MAG: hypothetical protein D6814_16305 [Calditrichaeota bacterium]|nr:MAG: hypothetical protein D6814_16305 [Calditrichota bacterium]